MNSDHCDITLVNYLSNLCNRRNYAAIYKFIDRKENILCLGQNDIDKYDSNVHAQCNYVATF